MAGREKPSGMVLARPNSIKISVLPLDQVPQALAARDTRGFIKLVADTATDRVLGGQILAPKGADSVQTLALALKARTKAMARGEMRSPTSRRSRG